MRIILLSAAIISILFLFAPSGLAYHILCDEEYGDFNQPWWMVWYEAYDQSCTAPALNDSFLTAPPSSQVYSDSDFESLDNNFLFPRSPALSIDADLDRGRRLPSFSRPPATANPDLDLSPRESFSQPPTIINPDIDLAPRQSFSEAPTIDHPDLDRFSRQSFSELPTLDHPDLDEHPRQSLSLPPRNRNPDLDSYFRPRGATY